MSRAPGAWWGRLRWAITQRGVVGMLRLLAGKLRGGGVARAMVHPFDVEHGVETSGLVGGGSLKAGHAHAVFSTAYFGVPPSRMRGMLERWLRTEGVGQVAAYAFVDVGCGKGRALLLASEMPFREVVGIELDGELARAARTNAERWAAAGRAQCPVRVILGDATEAELPEGPLVVYLYNPFRATVLRRLLVRLESRGEAVEVLYLYPEEEAVFAEFPRFRRMWRENVALAPEDVGVDEISAAEDPCSLYRLMN